MLGYPKELLISLLALAVAASVSSAQDASSQDSQNPGSHARIVRISYVEGAVQLNGQPASVNSPITEGAVLATGSDGLAEVEFEDSSAIRMASETQITFAQLARLSTGEAMTRADLDQGEAEFLIPASSAGGFAVEAGGKNILFREPGRFRILSTNSSPLEIAVWKGEARVRDRETGREVTVKRNETFTLNPADPGQYDLADSVLADDLDQWSEQRDQALSTALAQTYAPPYSAPEAYTTTYTSPSYYTQPVYGGYGFYNYAPCGYGFWQPFWMTGSFGCWNSGFLFQPFFFAPPTFVVVQPPVLPRRPPHIRPPVPPTIARAGSGGTVAPVKPGVRSFRFDSAPQRVFNEDNFQRGLARPAGLQPGAGLKPGETSPVLIAPGQRSAGNAPVAPVAHAPSTVSPPPMQRTAPATPPRPSTPPRSYSPRSYTPPRSSSPPRSSYSGSRGFSGGSVSHSSGASHSGGSGWR